MASIPFSFWMLLSWGRLSPDKCCFPKQGDAGFSRVTTHRLPLGPGAFQCFSGFPYTTDRHFHFITVYWYCNKIWQLNQVILTLIEPYDRELEHIDCILTFHLSSDQTPCLCSANSLFFLERFWPRASLFSSALTWDRKAFLLKNL